MVPGLNILRRSGIEAATLLLVAGGAGRPVDEHLRLKNICLALELSLMTGLAAIGPLPRRRAARFAIGEKLDSAGGCKLQFICFLLDQSCIQIVFHHFC